MKTQKLNNYRKDINNIISNNALNYNFEVIGTDDGK